MVPNPVYVERPETEAARTPRGRAAEWRAACCESLTERFEDLEGREALVLCLRGCFAVALAAGIATVVAWKLGGIRYDLPHDPCPGLSGVMLQPYWITFIFVVGSTVIDAALRLAEADANGMGVVSNRRRNEAPSPFHGKELGLQIAVVLWDARLLVGTAVVVVSCAMSGGTPWEAYTRYVVVVTNSAVIHGPRRYLAALAHGGFGVNGGTRRSIAFVRIRQLCTAVAVVACLPAFVTHILPAAILFVPLLVLALIAWVLFGLGVFYFGGGPQLADADYDSDALDVAATGVISGATILMLGFQMLASYAVIFYGGVGWVETWSTEFWLRATSCYLVEKDRSASAVLSVFSWL